MHEGFKNYKLRNELSLLLQRRLELHLMILEVGYANTKRGTYWSWWTEDGQTSRRLLHIC
jgi:hypothetical protein